MRPALTLIAGAVLAATALIPSTAASASTGASCAAVASRPSRVGHIEGIVRPAGRHARAGCAGAVNTAEPAYGGTPPLLSHGGNVMGTPADGSTVVVTPIYWSGPTYSFDASYENVINGYLTNVAADSGRYTNVFSALGQYIGANGSPPATYSVTAGAPIYDTTTPIPASGGCTVDGGGVYSDNSGYSACVDDATEQTEIQSIVAANGLPYGLGHIYVLFLPKGVESCFGANDACTINSSPDAAYCAYHSSFPVGGTDGVYANMPFPVYKSPTGYTCGTDNNNGNDFGGVIQSPNGQPDADVEISPTSHELNEAFSDPNGDAWFDATGNENGDDCAYIYGATTGDPTAGQAYNQTINGAHYITQEEFSNRDFVPGTAGCVQSEPAPILAPTVSGLSPRQGPLAGGNTVTISGTGFTTATAVSFGSTAATSYTVVSDTQITAVAPASATTTPVNVTVTNVTGTSATSSSDVYKYYAVPVVTSVTPNSGPTAGGQTVTIKGQWFSAGSKVKFGTIVLAHGSFTVVNARTITATTPAHPAGYVNVTVTTPGGTSAKSAGSKYTFK